MPIPTRKQWQDMKKKYGVANGAVSGIDVGGEIDKYWKMKNAKEMESALGVLEVKLNQYITKLDKAKVKQYAPFQKDFLDNYLGETHKMREDLKRYNATADIYRKELVKFFTAVQKLDRARTTGEELQKFRSGPVRGLSALGKNVKGGVDTKEIDKWLGTIDAAVLKMNDPERREIVAFINTTIKTAEQIAKLAKAQHLV